jgi:hypothetical protein
MTGDTSQAPAPASTAQETPAASKPAPPRKSTFNPLLIGAVGGLLTLAAAGFILTKADIGFSTGGDPAQPTLTLLDQRDLGAAASTLTPSAAGPLVEDAQRCRVPLASMTLAKGTAPIGSTIRIKSGSYNSPYFTVTEGMQRIAVPYPAPYGSGVGTITVEGNASGAVVGLTPARAMSDLPGVLNIPVIWRPVSPC